jgi:hypothetical protein
VKNLVIIIVALVVGCTPEKQRDREIMPIYQNTIGDIAFDKSKDDPQFIICHPYWTSPQYYQDKFQYEGELSAIKEEFAKMYDLTSLRGQDGFITIRFVVNCKGQTGRFRIYEVNKELKEFSFDVRISESLLNIAKHLSKWKIQKAQDGTPMDYYQYLTFKIENGQIKEITP